MTPHVAAVGRHASNTPVVESLGNAAEQVPMREPTPFRASKQAAPVGGEERCTNPLPNIRRYNTRVMLLCYQFSRRQLQPWPDCPAG